MSMRIPLENVTGALKQLMAGLEDGTVQVAGASYQTGERVNLVYGDNLWNLILEDDQGYQYQVMCKQKAGGLEQAATKLREQFCKVREP